MIQWKERLYAFLIRKFVGPWLDEETSRQQLYQLIDVSLQDGIFVLRNVSLSTDKVTAAIKQPIRIRKATIDKLEIRLNLQEHQQQDKDDTKTSSESSLAWRAWKLGSAGAVAVMVQVLIEGILVEIDPISESVHQVPVPSNVAENSETSKGMFSSYMDAVLASLRLSVDIRNMEVKLYSTLDEEHSQHWVSFRIQSLSYHDINQTTTVPPTSEEKERSYETIMQKTVEVQRISVLVGTQKEPEKASITTVGLLDGKSQLKLRVIEYFSPLDDSAKSEKPVQIQHDIDISLGQKLSFLFDGSTIETVAHLVQQYLQSSVLLGQIKTGSTETHVAVVESTCIPKDSLEEDRRQAEEDMQTLDVIMKQYIEARRLAEQNQMKGGMLLPDEDDPENMTFDVFFDANDQSIYRYSTVMSHLGDTSAESGDADFVYLKFRLLLPSGSLKLTYGESKLVYLLAEFSDFAASASFSSNASVLSATVNQLEIEESCVVHLQVDGRRRTEISRVLHFTTYDNSRELSSKDEGELLIESPCLSIDVKRMKHQDTLQCQLHIEPVQISLQHPTLENLSRFAQNLRLPPSKSADDVPTDEGKVDGSRN
jgi:hypothetical protein